MYYKIKILVKDTGIWTEAILEINMEPWMREFEILDQIERDAREWASDNNVHFEEWRYN